MITDKCLPGKRDIENKHYHQRIQGLHLRSPPGVTCHVSPCREPMPAKNLSSHLSPHLVPSTVSAHLSVLRRLERERERERMKWEAQTVLNTIHRKIQTLCIWLNLLPKPHSTVSNKEMGNTNESLIYPPLNFLHITRSVFVSMGYYCGYIT